MTEQDIATRIRTELKVIKAEEANLNRKYEYTYHSGMGTFDLLQDIERARKRQTELEDALRILAEFK